MAFFNWGKKHPKTKQSYDFNSPAFLELMRSGGHSGPVSPDSAMRLSTVYACVKVLSDTISTLPLYLYNKKGESREKADNRLATLLHGAPNSFQTSSEWLQLQVTNICLRGNSYSYIVRTGDGRVVELLPLPSDAVSVNVTAQNTVEYQIELGQEGNTRTITAQPSEVLHLKNLTLDGINGISPIAYNSELLSSAINARDHSNSVFTNGATPRGVLETDGILSDEAFENLKSSWSAAHGGTANANKVAILESGMTFKPVSLSPADVQLLDSRKYSRSEIAGMFRVPPHMIGDLERATYSNIGHQSLDFYKSAISPWLTQFESRLNFSLLGNSMSCFRFDIAELIRGDVEAEVASYRSLVEMGVLSPNEVRAKLGMNPRDKGDEYVTQSNNLQFGDEDNPADKDPKQDA